MERLVASENLLMQLLVYLYGIGLNELASSLVVALGFDTLDLGKELAEEVAELLIVVDLHIGLAIALNEFNHVVGLAVLVGPAGDELTVAHVCLLDDGTRLDTYELCHETIHHLTIVFSLVSFGIGYETKFYHLGVGQVVESEEVGACLLDGRAVSLQRIGVNTREQLARAVAETLVEVGVEVAGERVVLLDEAALFVAIYKLLVESATHSCHIVGFGEVADGY